MSARTSRRWSIGLIIATFAAYLVLRGIQISFPRSLDSTDGAFQTLSAVMRYSAGQVPIRDFYPYLGIGVSVSLVPLYVLTGQHLLLSSNLSVAVVLFSANVGGLACLFRINGLRLRGALIATLTVCLLVGYASFEPGQSLRPLRAALPLIVAAMIYVVSYRRRGERFDRGAAALYGLCLSIAPLWSNDFGPPTLAAFLLAWIVYAPDWRQRAGGLALVCGIVLAVNAPLIAGMGGLGRFIEVQSGFSKDQFWFFGPWGSGVQVFALADLRHLIVPPFARLPLLYGAAPVVLLALAAIMLVRRLRGRQRPGDATAFAVTLASAGGVVIPQIGGHIDAGYAAYSLTIVWALLIIEATRWPRFAAAVASIAERPVRFRLRVGDLVLPALCTLFVLYFAALAANAVYKALPMRPTASAAWQAIGVYPRTESDDVACFARVGTLFDRHGVPADRRMLSTYLSALNLAARAQQPMKVDSVIHLLGERFRDESLTRIDKARPVLFTTISPEYAPWGRWNERASWPVFGPAYRHYEPVVRTQQHVVWMRMTDAQARQENESAGVGRKLPCSVRRQGMNDMAVEIEGATLHQPVWAQVRLDQSVTLPAHEALAPLRSILTVKESPDTAPFFEEPADSHAMGWRAQRYGIDMTRHPLTVAFDMKPGERSRLDFLAEPEGSARLDIGSCKARIAAPQRLDPIDRIPRLGDCVTLLNAVSRRLDALGYRSR